MDLNQLIPEWIRTLTAHPPGMPSSEPQASGEMVSLVWT